MGVVVDHVRRALLGVAHATWNSLAHAVSDRLVGFALIGVVDAVAGGLMAAFAGLPPAGVWPVVIASAALHVAYDLLLLASYELGEFSQMYPLARGTSPWVVALISVLVLGRDLPLTELLVLAVSGGLTALVFIGGVRISRRRDFECRVHHRAVGADQRCAGAHRRIARDQHRVRGVDRGGLPG